MNCICVTCGTTEHSSDPNDLSNLCKNGHDDWLEYRDIEMALREKDRDAKRFVHRAKKKLGKTVDELIDMMKEGHCI